MRAGASKGWAEQQLVEASLPRDLPGVQIMANTGGT